MMQNTADANAQARCPHCGTRVEGDSDAFCCSGCEIAAAIIRGAGLEEYYQKRTAFAPRPIPAPSAWSAVPVTELANGRCEANLVIDDLRCASCVWLIERVLERSPGVELATVSYATGRTHVRWRSGYTSLAELAERVAQLGYRPRAIGEESTPDRSLLVRLGVAAFAAMNLMLIGASLYTGWWQPMDTRFAALFRWLSLVLATPVAIWCASPFFRSASAALRNGVLHIDLPIALGVAIMYVHGFVATLLGADAYFDSLGMLVALLLAGRYLESRGRRRAIEASNALVARVPRSARRIIDGHIDMIAVSDLMPGDRIDIPAGEELPADGVVVEGGGELRVALLTGEATPIAIGIGDNVLAGTLLVSGAITVEVRAVGSATVVHAMAMQLAAATARDPRPSTADLIAPWFTAATLLAAAVTFLLWAASSGLNAATLHTVAVLVVACPCALALAQPLAASAALAAAARRGLLLRSPDALLDLATVDVVGLDKTGTVTEGELIITQADDATLRIAAALERRSAHPIARAILAEAARREIALPALEQGEVLSGVGVRGVVDGQLWLLTGGSAPGELMLYRDDGSPRGSIRTGDAVRPDARTFVERLERQQMRVSLLTGDSDEAATIMARSAGIREIAARVLPDEKAAWVAQQQAAGHRVLFIGDGINDGPALAKADVGIAMASGAASTVLVADAVLASKSLTPVLVGRHAAEICMATIRQNQRRSIVYNVFAVGAAMLGLVNPLVAAVLMPLSSSMVIWASSRIETRLRKLETA